MIKDRAAVVATTVMGVLRRALHDPEVEREIAELVRQEFRDIKQEARTERRDDSREE